MQAVIEVKDLSKKYFIGQKRSYLTLRDSISHLGQQLAGQKIKSKRKSTAFWALRHLNFKIKPGEVVGIIGRNGAGKSTLLKILSRITLPTEGKATLHGKLGSLLEVGTGFHQELTGRENIFLNGAILGMSRNEIIQKFDLITEFSGITDFIDTPVKHYSSGMYVRLAFAVAAHLESDILLVDEVLAVGDAEFQKKCLAKIRDISGGGRTVIFVSHDLQAIQSLCSKAIWMDGGQIVKEGSPAPVIRAYLHSTKQKLSFSLKDRQDRSGKGNLLFSSLSFLNQNRETDSFAIGDSLTVKLKIQNITHRLMKYSLGMSLRDDKDIGLISCDSNLIGRTFSIKSSELQTLYCDLPKLPLNYGNYYLNVAIFCNEEPEDWIMSAGRFQVDGGQFPGRKATNPFPVLTEFQWREETL